MGPIRLGFFILIASFYLIGCHIATPNRTVVKKNNPWHPFWGKNGTYTEGQKIKISDFIICAYTPKRELINSKEKELEMLLVYNIDTDSVFQFLLSTLQNRGLVLSVKDSIENLCKKDFLIDNLIVNPRRVQKFVRREFDLNEKQGLWMMPIIQFYKNVSFNQSMSSNFYFSGGWKVKEYVIFTVFIFDGEKIIHKRQTFIDSKHREVQSRAEGIKDPPPGPYISDYDLSEMIRLAISKFVRDN